MTIRRGIVDTPHGQVHARAVGGEGRPLLLLHQSPRSGLMYESLMEHIARPTMAPDRLGYGFSDPGPDDPTIETYAESTMAVVDDAGWDSFDVLGIHTGSMEAVSIGIGWPDRVNGVAIVAVPVFNPEEAAEIASLYAEPGRGRSRTDPTCSSTGGRGWCGGIHRTTCNICRASPWRRCWWVIGPTSHTGRWSTGPCSRSWPSWLCRWWSSLRTTISSCRPPTCGAGFRSARSMSTCPIWIWTSSTAIPTRWRRWSRSTYRPDSVARCPLPVAMSDRYTVPIAGLRLAGRWSTGS